VRVSWTMRDFLREKEKSVNIISGSEKESRPDGVCEEKEEVVPEVRVEPTTYGDFFLLSFISIAVALYPLSYSGRSGTTWSRYCTRSHQTESS
jgi:hypothetical protein